MGMSGVWFDGECGGTWGRDIAGVVQVEMGFKAAAGRGEGLRQELGGGTGTGKPFLLLIWGPAFPLQAFLPLPPAPALTQLHSTCLGPVLRSLLLYRLIKALLIPFFFGT